MNDDSSLKEQQDGGRSHWWRRVTQRLAGGPRTREDLLGLLRDAREAQLLDADAMSMFEGILQTAELHVRDVMVPRAQMVTIERDWTLAEVLDVVIESGHSRFPVVGESKDEVLGILLAKDLLRYAAAVPGGGAPDFDLQRLLRPAGFVPESKRLNVLLKEFRRSRNHMALVVDEYGGVAGLITIEDVLEQIVGEIDDEYDEAEGARILRQDERRYLVSALTSVEEFNAHFGTKLPTGDFDTIGGYVLHLFGHMPKRGESVQLERLSFNVQRADKRRVHQFLVTVAPA
ncbi:magnesium and cobalt transporter [Solimonas aquatica]|uniref:Magnesium and cobalt efflux protein CorC n=1 Tax=Solimonas aquatica TaxID=489703 RepID=A0A1H9M5M4_9GAMM|nr:transporter associated domain-containing protein [Solimonas aquatica]SER18964.1 magnesium and cobalt transporter [Solimonas aquatica]